MILKFILPVAKSRIERRYQITNCGRGQVIFNMRATMSQFK